MRRKKKKLHIGRDGLLYGFSFLLLLEWLLPLPMMTYTGYINGFLFATVLFFLVSFLQIPLLFSFIVRTIIIFAGLFFLFPGGGASPFEWIQLFISDMTVNIGQIIQGNWHELSDVFRSLLFFVLLSIMSFLLFYWTVYLRRIFFFLMATVIFVAVIDTFTLYDATFAIIRIVVIGFLLLGLVTMYRTLELHPVSKVPQFLPVRISLLIVGALLVTAVAAFVAPKPGPQWADPVPFLQAAVTNDESGQSGTQRIGYGDNDEQLGGGFENDDTPVFMGSVERSLYWRGETKDFYSGTGWQSTTPESLTQTINSDDVLETSDATERELKEARVTMYGGARFSHLFHPGELYSSFINENSSDPIYIDEFTAKAEVRSEDEPLSLEEYSFEYVQPAYTIDGLREVSGDDPDDIVEYYTQLPDSLPERVRDLAEELTSDADNRYDQAKAIEEHFAGPEFIYETEDVPVPDEGQDYVDQFLFETQRGYCDNYSTSMVVLLRSMDIPARWVKGFTGGTLVDTNEELNVYTVSNSNAHSWVEVYFPEEGWVTFEPTRGFSNTYEFEQDVESEPDPLESPDTETETEEEPENEVEQEPEEDEELEQSGVSDNQTNSGSSVGIWIVGGIVLVLLGLLLFYRKTILTLLMLRYYSAKDKDIDFERAYERLLWLLNLHGYRRDKSETLSEYAHRMDQDLRSDDMKVLTQAYEQRLYSGSQALTAWGEHKQRWERIVRKIKP
ncbi:transglutaminase-like putative cysteine protease [Alkalicoccobacillus murimartini]|uniref:Transglutaminase-like putative cysteine protease n=1 Tax=Alkalicoccobacillus murimartini TaxID=171685 RepID=A0ABT9YN80_9BACI|nr:transglutaminase-like putative cysteine protease [Alkalicoccobacillus murimartini]